MPPKRNPIVLVPSRVKKSQPATIRVARSKAPAPIVRTVNTNYNRERYPWDDHQDDIVVNSVEAVRPWVINSPAGAEHYLQALNQHKEYKHICTHPNEYRRLLDTIEHDTETEDEPDSGSVPHLDIDYTRTPHPPNAIDDYNNRIYAVNISNPAVFLAVIRIAQRNLPFMDFTSAINHLPNLPLHKSVPKPSKHGFTEDVPYEKRNTDTQMTLAFLPDFYHDGRHALGYYHLVPTASLAQPLAPPVLGTCLFTPCTTSDLMHFKLVEWLPDKEYAEVQIMNVVGGRLGQWLHADVVEEWEAWKMVLSRGWQGRLALYFGKEEGGEQRGT
jgi:hypothetical protein